MTTTTLASPMSFYGQTARTVHWANHPTSTGWKIAAWTGAVVWLLVMYSIIAVWYVALIPFLWIVIPLRAHRRGQRKADQLAETQNTLTQQQMTMQALQLQQQMQTQRDLDTRRSE